MKSSGAIILRLTHTGVYADGRPNTGSVTLYDLEEPTIQKNRPRSIPIPVNSTVDIPMSTRTFISWSTGSINTFVKQGLLTAELLVQLRDKQNCGGPAGTGQSLRPGVPNVERLGGVLRLVIPDNVIPTTVDSLGFLRSESLEIVGLTGAFQRLNGSYVITAVGPGNGLGGPEVGSYLVEVLSPGPDIAPATLAGVTLCLTEGRIAVEFTSSGDLGGLGANVFGYVGGQTLPGISSGGVAAHSPTHISGGTDEIEADLLNITFVPSRYVRTPTAPSTLVEELTSHLAGIDFALGGVPLVQNSALAYNGLGQLETVTYQDLSVKTLVYNGLGQLETVTYLGVTKTLSYNPDGTLATVTLS